MFADLAGEPPAARASGSLMSVLGFAWCLMAAGALARPWALVVAGAGFLVGLSLLSASRHRLGGGDRPPSPHARRVYNRVGAAQGIAIPLVAVAAGASGRPALVAPLIAAVVGLHFLPLAGAYRWRGYLAQGAGLLAVAVAGVLMASSGADVHEVGPVVGLGAAAMVWAGPVLLLLGSARHGSREGGLTASGSAAP